MHDAVKRTGATDVKKYKHINIYTKIFLKNNYNKKQAVN